MKWILLILMGLLLIPIVLSIEECESIMVSREIPCSIVSAWQYPNNCDTYNILVYDNTQTKVLDLTMGDHAALPLCNATFNVTTQGSYLLNFSSGDTAIILIEEDNNMLIALVGGISLIVILFIILTFAVREDKPFLANFFFLGIFIFTTVLSNLIWKITNVNNAPYEPIMLIVYRIFLIITMLMILTVLVLVTIDAVQLRKWKGNPVDDYKDNLEENEKDKF